MTDEFAAWREPTQGDEFASWREPAQEEQKPIPKPFLDRLGRGSYLAGAIDRILGKAGEAAKEGYGEAPATGVTDETLGHFIDLGIFHDPARGRPGILQFANEAWMQPVARGLETIKRGLNAGLYGVGAAAQQISDELDPSNAGNERVKNEVINFGNFAMIEGGMGRFSRIKPGHKEPITQEVGALPRDVDFKIGADLLGEKNIAEPRLKALWEDRGIHPAEAVHDAERDAFLKHDLTTAKVEPELKPEVVKEFEEFGVEAPKSLSAAVSDPPLVSPEIQPLSPPGQNATYFQNAARDLLDIGRDIRMKVDPMGVGSTEAQGLAKEFADTLRRNRWDWSRYDKDFETRFTAEQRKRMWDAADEESTAQRLMESTEHQGLVTLTAEERAAVEEQHTRSQNAWVRARDLGMVEGEGLPAYTPRMIINAASAHAKDGPVALNAFGGKLRTRTAQMMRREYMTAEETEAAAKARLGSDAELARDIRALPLATAKLEDAIAGRKLIDGIKDYGARVGTEVVWEGTIPNEVKSFTIDHPAFKVWRPKFGVKDADGNQIFEQVPLRVHSDFEGPLRAVLDQKNGALYSAAMDMKGKTMSLIMNSPLIHYQVVWGKAFPAFPGQMLTWKFYSEGSAAKSNPEIMHRYLDAGGVPITSRFYKQDISSIMAEPGEVVDRWTAQPWTAKLLGAVPGLFDEAAGKAVESFIHDKIGNFWHNKMLWDRVANLQMAVFTNLSDRLVLRGSDRLAADMASAHFSNLLVGSLPQEAMSKGARSLANVFFFSRSFTLSNQAIFLMAVRGLPAETMALLEKMGGNLTPEAKSYVQWQARRKAFTTVLLDVAFAYAGISLLQSAANMFLLRGSDTLSDSWDKEMRGYADRLNTALQKRVDHPMSLLQPFEFLESVSATSENEPGKKGRVLVGYAKDGTGIYARSPVGKIGEELADYFGSALDVLKRKEGTVARPMLQVMANDKGFGRKVYDPHAETPAENAGAMWEIIKHFMKAQTPEGQINAFSDLVKGEGDKKVNVLQAFGPLAGTTFSRGAPGGPAVGEMYNARSRHDIALQMALPDIRRQIQNGQVEDAQRKMNELGVPLGLQKFYIRTTQNPATRLGGRALKDFYYFATPEQKQRMEMQRARPQSGSPPVDTDSFRGIQ